LDFNIYYTISTSWKLSRRSLKYRLAILFSLILRSYQLYNSQVLSLFSRTFYGTLWHHCAQSTGNTRQLQPAEKSKQHGLAFECRPSRRPKVVCCVTKRNFSNCESAGQARRRNRESGIEHGEHHKMSLGLRM